MASETMRLVRPVLRAHRRDLGALAAWSLVETLPVLLSGTLVAAALDHGFLDGRVPHGLLLLLAYGVTMVIGTLGTRQAMPHTAAMVESLRDALIGQVVRAGLHRAVYPESGAGHSGGPITDVSTVARLTRQVETVRQISGGLLLSLRGVVLAMVAAMIGLCALDPLLALITGGAVLTAAALTALLSRVLRRRHVALLRAQEELARRAGPHLTGIRDVVTCGAWKTAGRTVGTGVDAEAAAAVASARAGAGRIAVVAVGTRLPFAIILLSSPWLVSSAVLTPGALVGAMVYLLQGIEPALRAMVQTVSNMGLQLSVTLHRLTDFIHVPPRPPSGTASLSGAGAGAGVGKGTDIALRDVLFAYGPHAEPLFSRLSLDIPYGSHLAIVGPSGIGKSTLACLAGGLERARRGVVTVGGIPVPELAEDELRRQVAVVPQESYVFAGTLRENLALLRPDVPESELDAAAVALGLGETVRRLGGYDAVIGSPGVLSQGERQLITLARVYVSEARVVILDEATCHLDRTGEERVEDAFIARPGTLIVVAHRIISALRAERIAVVGQDSLTVGSHDELLWKSAEYAELIGYWSSAGESAEPAGESTEPAGEGAEAVTSRPYPLVRGERPYLKP
ncbi:ABC transporter ATP-binding protein [Streptomyces sp. NPDC087525]|uniref:ABC transporter ATP-binding protein n=1 Tax=Streptomyces sp. NPDC087525 TaxID=3365793 RepID=UPI0037FB79E4